MGQKLDTQCADGGLWCCAPAPEAEASNEVQAGPRGDYPGSGTSSPQPDRASAEADQRAAQAAKGPASSAPGPKPSPSSGAGSTGAGSGFSGASPGSGSAAGLVSFDLILSDLEGSEQMAYGEAFSGMAAGSNFLGLDNARLRDFIIANTVIDINDLDVELLRVASEDLDNGLSMPQLLQILRENATAETTSIEEFLGMSGDGVTVSAEDCRSRLLLFGQRKLNARFSEDQWDRIFNVVMMDADIVVPLEQWISYCKSLARISRLCHFAGC